MPSAQNRQSRFSTKPHTCLNRRHEGLKTATKPPIHLSSNTGLRPIASLFNQKCNKPRIGLLHLQKFRVAPLSEFRASSLSLHFPRQIIPGQKKRGPKPVLLSNSQQKLFAGASLNSFVASGRIALATSGRVSNLGYNLSSLNLNSLSGLRSVTTTAYHGNSSHHDHEREEFFHSFNFNN